MILKRLVGKFTIVHVVGEEGCTKHENCIKGRKKPRSMSVREYKGRLKTFNRWLPLFLSTEQLRSIAPESVNLGFNELWKYDKLSQLE